MDWLTIKTLRTLLSKAGADGVSALVDRIEAAAQDGSISIDDAVSIVEGALDGTDAELAAAVRQFVSDNDAAQALRWLSRPLEANAAETGTRRYPLLSVDEAIVSGPPLSARFEADATLSLTAAVVEARPEMTVTLAGTAGVAASGAATPLPDVLKSLTLSASARRTRSIAYTRGFAPETGTAAAVRDTLAAMRSPFDATALADGFDAGMDKVVVETGSTSSLAGAASAALPLKAGAVVVGGGLTLDVSIARDTDSAATLTLSPGEDGGIEVQVSAGVSRASIAGAALGVSVRFATPRVIRTVADGLEIADATLKAWAEELAGIADLSEEIETAVRDRLQSALGDDPASAIGDALFDAESADALRAALIDALQGEAAPWIDAAALRARTRASALLRGLGLAGLEVDGQTLEVAASGWIDDVAGALSARLDEKIAAFIDNHGVFARADGFLGALGGRLTGGPVADAEALAAELKARLLRWSDEAGKLAKLMTRAANFTLAANYSVERTRASASRLVLALDLDPREPGARTLLPRLAAAPRGTAHALCEGLRRGEDALSGVTIEEASEARRFSDAVSRTFNVKLFGFERGSGRDAKVTASLDQVGSLVTYRAQATTSAYMTTLGGGELSRCSAVYMVDETRKRLASAKGRSLSGDARIAPFGEMEAGAAGFTMTFATEDRKGLYAGEARSMLERFAAADLIGRDTVDAVVRRVAALGAAGGAPATLELGFVLTNAQIRRLAGGTEPAMRARLYLDSFAANVTERDLFWLYRGDARGLDLPKDRRAAARLLLSDRAALRLTRLDLKAVGASQAVRTCRAMEETIDDADRFSALIGELDDAALEPKLDAVKRKAAAVGGHVANFVQAADERWAPFADRTERQPVPTGVVAVLAALRSASMAAGAGAPGMVAVLTPEATGEAEFFA